MGLDTTVPSSNLGDGEVYGRQSRDFSAFLSFPNLNLPISPITQVSLRFSLINLIFYSCLGKSKTLVNHDQRRSAPFLECVRLLSDKGGLIRDGYPSS